jgi:gliding motility-associated-like protein
LIHAFPYPHAWFTAYPEEAVLPWTTFDFINLSLGYETSYWTFGVEGTSWEEEPSFEFQPELSGSYPDTLLVTNQWGCQDSITRNVEIFEIFEIYAPNTFTPDGDGINEIWRIEGIDIDPSNFTMEIFNRWGDMVFQTFDFETVWDGSYMTGDHYVPDGVYVYHIVAYSLSDGIQKELFGHINVIR